MSARAPEIWRVVPSLMGECTIVGTDSRGNDVEIASVDDPDHARRIAKVPQLLELVRELAYPTTLSQDKYRATQIAKARELLAEINGKWPGDGGAA